MISYSQKTKSINLIYKILLLESNIDDLQIFEDLQDISLKQQNIIEDQQSRIAALESKMDRLLKVVELEP